MTRLQQEIGDLLSSGKEDHFSCPGKAREKAMDFLARREYGQLELIKKLSDKGYERNVAELAVTGLTTDGLQSDRRFASAFVQSRIHQGKGPVRIRLDLDQRGIESATVEQAIDESDTQWIALAKHVRSKKFGPEPAVDFDAKAKQMRFLQYRGFEQDQIKLAMRGD